MGMCARESVSRDVSMNELHLRDEKRLTSRHGQKQGSQGKSRGQRLGCREPSLLDDAVMDSWDEVAGC